MPKKRGTLRTYLLIAGILIGGAGVAVLRVRAQPARPTSLRFNGDSGFTQLTVSLAGTGTGTVTSNVSGINCPTVCSASYNTGASITLTASAAGGSTFAGWSGACSGTGACVVSTNSNQSATATFNVGTFTVSQNISNGATLSGSVIWTATVSGSVSISSVGFFIDGVLKWTEGAAPYQFNGDPNGTLDTTTLSNGSHTLMVKATASDGSTASNTVTVTVSNAPGTFSLTVSKAGSGSGTVTSSPSGINCGSTCSASYNSGTSVTLTAAANSGSSFGGWSGACSGTGTCTVTMNSSQSATATFNVSSSFTGVFTYRNDNQRTGQNTQEVTLTPSNVNGTTFGKKFACTVDGDMYANPLYVANLNIGGKVRNVVYVATEHDSLYAFDADDPTCVQLWHLSFGTPALDSDIYIGSSSFWDLQPEIGITGTPVIDPNTNTIYVDAFTKDSSTSFVHRIHAIDLISSSEKFGGPKIVSPSGFVAKNHLQRPALLLANGNLYVAFGSVGDQTPAHGWLVAYNASTLSQVGAFNTTASGTGQLASFWQSGAGPSADLSGNIYAETGNGDWNGTSDFGDSVLKFGSTLSLLDWFTPFNQSTLNSQDLDVGSGGTMIPPDQSGSNPHEIVAVSKDNEVYLISRDNMTHFHSGGDTIVQEFSENSGSFRLFSTIGYWNGNLYAGASGDTLKAFKITNGLITTSPSSHSSASFTYGPTTTESSNGTSNGIVWALDARAYQPTVSAIVYAFDANNLGTLLWASNQNSTRDAASVAVKFTNPVVANGKVYVGGNKGFTVYGNLP